MEEEQHSKFTFWKFLLLVAIIGTIIWRREIFAHFKGTQSSDMPQRTESKYEEKENHICILCGNTGAQICPNCNGTGYTTYGNLPCTTCEPGSPHSVGVGYVKCNLHRYK